MMISTIYLLSQMDVVCESYHTLTVFPNRSKVNRSTGKKVNFDVALRHVATLQQVVWADEISIQMLTSGAFQANEEVPCGTLSFDGWLKVLELMGFQTMTYW
jgi:hypothetical protein